MPGLVRGALRVIRGRSVRARACALALLRELLVAAPGCLADHAARVIRALTPPLTYAFLVNVYRIMLEIDVVLTPT